MNFLQVFIIPYEGHLPSYPPMYYHLNFSYADVQFDKNAYPEMGKFWKNHENDIIPYPFVFQSMSEQYQW